MNTLILGQWNVICDRCGDKRKSSDVTRTWDGLIVCKPEIKRGCFEHRHPQDFVRAVKEITSVPFTRPEPADVFISATQVNCNCVEPIYYPNHIGADTTIAKGIVEPGPLVIEGGTITVLCLLEVRP